MSIELQEPLFRWAAAQPASMGVLILGAGIIYGFFGYKLYVPLLALSNAAIGGVIGIIASGFADVPPQLGAGIGALAGGATAMASKSLGALVGNATTFALVGAFLTSHFGSPPIITLFVLVIASAVAALLSLLCVRTMRVVLMSVQGAILMIVGFVGVTSQVIPSMGDTFRSLASSWALLTPLLLTMVVVTTYATQSNYLRGDMRTGAIG